ncbi:ArnT family glycosyltransferase [Salinirubellus salinus]|uniref:ArnT family glycosyltransferase n=1 Tax=Salinirubellus salinus TaxID=1364945 RepID=UPI0026E5381E|nr:glycosyltransferase family 39 protein [Salinirubellus salinus]
MTDLQKAVTRRLSTAHGSRALTWVGAGLRSPAAWLTLLGSLLYLPGLGGYPLRGWDEAIYATAARYALERGDYLVPHLYWLASNGEIVYEPFLEKPPLSMWLMTLSMGVFGPSEFAARLPQALAATAVAPVLYLGTRSLLGRRRATIAGGLWLTTTFVATGNNAARFGGTDALHTLFGTVFVFTVWRLVSTQSVTEANGGLSRPHHRPRAAFWAVGVAAGITLLIKGFAAGSFVIAVLPLALVRWHVFARHWQATLELIGITISIAVPWVLLAYLRYGETLVNELIREQVLARATGDLVETSFETTFAFMRFPYFRELPAQFDPWIYFLFPAVIWSIWYGVYRGDDSRVTTDGWLLWWGVSTVGVFVLTGNHGWYLLPAFVPGALLVAGLFDDALAGRLGALAGVAAGATLLLLYSFRLAGISPVASAKPAIPVTDGVPFVVLTALGTAAVCLYGAYTHTDSVLTAPAAAQGVLNSRLSRVLLGLVLVVGGVAVVGTSANTAGASYNEQGAFALALNEQLDSGEPVYLTPTATEQLALFTFGFYIDAPLATTPETPPDDGYLVAVEPAPDTVTPPAVAGGAEAAVAVAVELPDGRVLVAYDLGAVSRSP